MDNEFDSLNSVVKNLSSNMRVIVAHKVRSALINEEERMINYKQMFVNSHDSGVAQRTVIKDIAPASIRIKLVAHRSLKGINKAVDKVK